MASRQNITGRKDGYGGGPLSRVYGKAMKLAAANRKAGAAPGTGETMATRMGKLSAANTRRDARAAGEPVDQGQPRRGLFGGKKRGLMSQLASGAQRLAGGSSPVAGGAAALPPKLAAGIQATPAPAPPDITLNPMSPPPAPAAPQIPGLPAPAASMGQPTPMAQPSTSVETMGGPAPGAVAPAARGGRSVRSRGLHRSRRAPEDRG